jgi:DNA-binding response OmpR family regulator
MKARILVVEDDPGARLALTYRLQYDGYHVSEAENGETAIAKLKQQTFEIVLTDIVLGDVTGIEVLRVARNQPYRPVVILLTGHGSLNTSIAALREGAHDYLLKPCPHDKLLVCVAEAVKRYHNEKRLVQAANVIKDFYEPTTDELEDLAKASGPTATSARQDTLPPLRVGALVIGSTRQEVIFNDAPVHITPIEFALLRCLAETPGTVRTYCDMVSQTHSLEASEADAQSLLKPHIRNLRHKIDPNYLVNDRGTGYMLVDPAKIIGNREDE